MRGLLAIGYWLEVRGYYPLIRYSSCVVSCVDDATTGELGSLNEVKHAFVVAVRINADIGALCRTPMEYEREDTSLLPIRGNAMDRAVEQGVV